MANLPSDARFSIMHGVPLHAEGGAAYGYSALDIILGAGVTIGPPDSGGSGLRTLSLPNEPISAPTMVDVPHAAQEGDFLTCTMGNWNGEPTEYAYQWMRGGEQIGTGTPYSVQPADVGQEVTCVVTATNAGGSTEAPPSNPVMVEAPASREVGHGRRVPRE